MLSIAAAMMFPPVVSADEVLLEFDGNGAHTTRPFQVPDAWEVQWSASGDLFQLYLYEADGALAGLPANQVGAGNGSAYQPTGGRYYLQMNAIGPWEVTIVEVE